MEIIVLGVLLAGILFLAVDLHLQCVIRKGMAEERDDLADRLDALGKHYLFCDKIDPEDQRIAGQVEKYVSEEERTRCLAFIDPDRLGKELESKPCVREVFHSAGGKWIKLVYTSVEQKLPDGRDMVMLTVQDVTSWVKREQDYDQEIHVLETRERQREVAHMEFFRRISYDIRTPVSGICGMIDIANHYPQDHKRQQECRNKILEAALYLQHVVSEMLDVSYLGEDAKVTDRMPFNLYQVLDSVVESIEGLARDNLVEFEFDRIHIRNWELVGSPFYLRQVLTQMLRNIILKNAGNAKITLSARELSGKGDVSEFEFSCIGPDQSFDMLPIMRMAGRLNGFMDWTPSGHGQFLYRLVVPLEFSAQNAYTEEVRREEAVPRLQGKKVLLVEDNELNMEVSEFLFVNEGAVVIRAYNGREAVEIFKESLPGEFDLVLMDIMMPVMNGMEAAKAIRGMKRADAATVPIFAITANTYMGDVEKYRSAGMDEYFFKPFEADELLEKVVRYQKQKSE